MKYACPEGHTNVRSVPAVYEAETITHHGDAWNGFRFVGRKRIKGESKTERAKALEPPKKLKDREKWSRQYVCLDCAVLEPHEEEYFMFSRDILLRRA